VAGCGIDGDDVLHDWLPVSPLGRRFVGRIVNEPRFPDFCTPRGKWFHAPKNCFVAVAAMKQSGMNSKQFELDGF
jgi:hypothetical protein